MSGPGEINGHYNNTHRAFLQALLARQTITLADAKPLLASIQTAHTPDRPTLPEDVSQEDFDNYVHTLNDSLSPFDMEIRSTLHQQTKDRIYALVNTTSDALTQMSTSFKAEEIAFVKRVLDAMFETYNTPRAEIMAITGMQALKLAKAPADERRREAQSTQQATQPANTSIRIADAENILSLLVDEGWFELSQRGFYSLSPRALMELRGWLIETYNDQADQEEDSDEEEEERARVKIKFCAACRDIVTVGQRCPNRQCNARVHNHCVRTLFRAQGGREECPACKTAWQDPLPVGENAARQSGGAGSRRTTGGSSIGGGGRDDSSMTNGAEEV
ncbi:DNA repair protein Nse1 [Hortaea werneckii]|nr:DNA repair protein Nse1 [Hortaea werneckii]